MKKLFTIFTILSIILFPIIALAQNCCVKNGSAFKLLAMNADFKESHLAPEPLEYTPQNGGMVNFKTPDGKSGSAYFVPSYTPSNKVMILFHEWWGLNNYIKREAERWQVQLGNVDVYAVDLFDGDRASDPETASKLASGLDPVRAENIIKGILNSMSKNKLVATLGWCMGGSWSFTASVLAGKQAAGCVMFYGFPEKDSVRIASLKTDVLYIWGSEDKFIKREMVDELEQKVRANHHNFDLHIYKAEHAFANPSNPKFNDLAATQAEIVALKFLREKLELE